MSWTATTFLFAMPYDGPLDGVTLASFNYALDDTSELHGNTSSRNGALERQLADSCERAVHGAGLYVFGPLKSHHARLREAHRLGLTAVHARPSEDGV